MVCIALQVRMMHLRGGKDKKKKSGTETCLIVPFISISKQSHSKGLPIVFFFFFEETDNSD